MRPSLLDPFFAAISSLPGVGPKVEKLYRKLLRHTLGRWLDAQGFAGRFDTQRRAEEVPVEEYVALALQMQ